MYMTYEYPSKVLISGGHEVGGVGSFADALRIGFTELGIPVETVSPSQAILRYRELRDPRVLKILSTSAVFAAPFARRSICMAHGVPRVGAQGWLRFSSIIASYKLANLFPGTQLVSVSHYTASTLRALFNVDTDSVVYNAAKPLFLERDDEGEAGRNYITYVGRLIEAKNLHRILPAVRDLMDETPGLRMCIIGTGPQRPKLEEIVGGDDRFEFKGCPDDNTVRAWLRRTRVFVSGNEVEGFGISYLEAMSQGCIVAMPGSGGGIEIALENVGHSVQLLPLSWNRQEVLTVLKRALKALPKETSISPFTASVAVRGFLAVDRQFALDGCVAPHARAATPSPATTGVS
jgi:glycosyltransferase involved in cell wall biosynthesis